MESTRVRSQVPNSSIQREPDEIAQMATRTEEKNRQLEQLCCFPLSSSLLRSDQDEVNEPESDISCSSPTERKR
jgi:hypothetical protein